jgi:hypothetical protein
MKTIPLELIDLHPLVADLPMWDPKSEDNQLLVQDIQARGVDVPLIVVPGKKSGRFLLVDGRHRHRAAAAAGLDEVPVLIRKEAEAADIVLHSLANRRHLTKGALAYMSYPVLSAQACVNGGDRKSASIQSTLVSAEDICDRLGFGRDLFFQARQVHEIFAQDADYRAACEPLILEGHMGLGACIAGFAGRAATRNKKKPKVNYFSTCRTGLIAVKNAFKNWKHVPVEKRKEIIDLWHQIQSSLPEDLE